MTNKEIYMKWAPEGEKWVDWVRPVPFISINDNLYDYGEFLIPKVNYIDKMLKDTAIIVDLPSGDSVKEGIALAQLGFRPIPLYNGTNQQKNSIATVDNEEIQISLIKGAIELETIELSKEASPAFLLDSNRTNRFRMNETIFDNSWDIYDQDVPTAEYFKKNGIDKIIVRGNSIQKDLKRILYKFQKKGMKIFFTNGDNEPKIVKIGLNKLPFKFK